MLLIGLCSLWSSCTIPSKSPINMEKLSVPLQKDTGFTLALRGFHIHTLLWQRREREKPVWAVRFNYKSHSLSGFSWSLILSVNGASSPRMHCNRIRKMVEPKDMIFLYIYIFWHVKRFELHFMCKGAIQI